LPREGERGIPHIKRKGGRGKKKPRVLWEQGKKRSPSEGKRGRPFGGEAGKTLPTFSEELLGTQKGKKIEKRKKGALITRRRE